MFIWYFYEKDKEIGDFKITDYQLYDMTQDENIFKNDFEIIKSKVKEGFAHDLRRLRVPLTAGSISSVCSKESSN